MLDESLCILLCIFEYCWNNGEIFEKCRDKRFSIKGARDAFHIRLNTKQCTCVVVPVQYVYMHAAYTVVLFI